MELSFYSVAAERMRCQYKIARMFASSVKHAACALAAFQPRSVYCQEHDMNSLQGKTPPITWTACVRMCNRLKGARHTRLAGERRVWLNTYGLWATW